MSNKFINKYTNRLSLAKLAGVKNQVLININPDYVTVTTLERKAPFYQVTKPELLETFKHVSTDNIEIADTTPDINRILKKVNKDKNITAPAVILGINDFKFITITIPADTEDADLWFQENTSKFLPEGKSSVEFIYSYQLYKEDENYKHYFIVITRFDFINKLVPPNNPDNVIAIIPFAITIFTLPYFDNKNTLYISLSNNKIIYSFRSETGNILYKDLYFEIHKDGFEYDTINKDTINKDNLSFCLEEIKQTISLSFGSQGIENIGIYLCTAKNEYDVVYYAVSKIFDTDNINLYQGGTSPSLIDSVLAYNNYLHVYNRGINLLPEDYKTRERLQVEKKVALKFTLAGGLILLVILLILFAGESYLNGRIEAAEESYLSVMKHDSEIEQFKLENIRLEKNLKMLSELKEKNSRYSGLLYSMTEIISPGCCLTEFEMKEIKPESISLQFSGLAYDQQSVAEIISRMESSEKFTETLLINSSVLQKGTENPEGNNIRFIISAKYNADRK